MRSFLREYWAPAFAGVTALLVATAALAQHPWPARPVTIIVPYPPGGSNDVFARELGKKLSDAWKIPVVIDNRPGGGGSIGAALVARAKPDGYTFCLLSSSFTTNAAVQKELPFDPVNDFAPVAMVAKGPMLLTVSNKLPVNSTLELFALARKDPGKLNYGSSGVGSTNQFATELLMDAAKIKMTHIPYKGMSPAITDTIAGNVDVLIASAPSIYPQVKAGRVKALGVTSAAAFAPIPDLRPVAQMGAPGYSFELWWGILAPKETPPEIVIQANIDVNKILDTPEMKQTFAHEGAEAAPMSAAAFAATIQREIEGWKSIAKAANIQAE
ncbi:MAG TPA: tripartite tricarboxylate transporter substrate binding protein [Usitatibacter sp.]|nr:tripartite tricarboxylate transporter substrate binding protein [Usitatibacter sp.]